MEVPWTLYRYKDTTKDGIELRDWQVVSWVPVVSWCAHRGSELGRGSIRCQLSRFNLMLLSFFFPARGKFTE